MSTPASTRSRDSRANTGGEKKQEEEQDDDEVYQYPKAGLGPVFASIEGLLRCAICRGVSDPPVSLPCCQQTFCSLCIRQYLDSTTPRCPCCRAASASNQLLMCKELRTICAMWKRNRQAILAAADASSEAAAAAGATDSGGVPSADRRRVCAVGAGQGRDGGGGKMAKLYYHQLTEKVLKQKLLDVGLPVGGGKAAMIARHKRLALLDAASSDREVPVSRRELIRQVASWEREKDKEKQAARSVAGGILSSSVSSSASSSSSASAGQPAQSTDGPGDGSVPSEADKIVIPKKMQAGFSALIANARKNAKKRPSTGSGSEVGNGGGTTAAAGAGGGDSKRARVSRGAGSGSAGGGEGADICNGSGSNGGSGSLGGGGSGGRSAGGSVTTANGGGAEMRILGVAGRMVRTRGPWRCVFSNGRVPPLPLMAATPPQPPPPPPAVAVAVTAAAAAAPSKRSAEERQKVETSMGSMCSIGGSDCRGRSSIASGNGHADAVAAASSSGEGQGGGGATAGGGEGSVVGGGGGGGSSGSGRGEDSAKADTGEMHVVPEQALREGGLVYLNTTTGETVREPPAELVTRAEEADSAGEYLVFVPSRSFVEAVGASSGLSEAASMVGAAAETMLQAVVDAGSSSASRKAPHDDGGGRGTEAPPKGCREEDGPQQLSRRPSLEAPTPPTAVKPVAAAAAASASGGSSDGGGGGFNGGAETWDRLSSLPMIDLSQGAPTAPLDVENAGAGGGGTGAGSAVAVTAEGAAAAAMWTCTACTLLNKARRTTCAVCANARPKSFETQQPAAPLSSSSSRSKLRLLQRRSGRGVPQSSITSFTSRRPSDASDDSGKSKATGGGEVQLVSSPPSSAAPMSAAGAAPPPSQPPPPSQSSVTAPISGFPTVRPHDRSCADVVAAAAPEKPQR